MKHPTAICAALAGFVLLGADAPDTTTEGGESLRETAAASVPVAAPPPAPVPPQIPVALLVDVSTGQTLYTREEHRRFMPASVTKVMTVFTAFGLIEKGQLNPGQNVVISKKLADEWSGEGSSMFLQAGDNVSVAQLLLGVTTVSANDGAVALGEKAAGSLPGWLKMMNANAAKLGMHDTYFGSPNGYPDEGHTFTSAHDLALLADAMITRYPALYHSYFGHHGMTYGKYTQSNHDPVTGVVKGADGIKTGYTRQAGYNFLGSAERDGRRLVMVLAGSPTASLRNKAARDFLNWGFDAFHPHVLLEQKARVGVAAVQGGAEAQVALVTDRDVLANLPEGAKPDAKLTIRYRGPIEAPIAAGAKIASLHVQVRGQQPFDVPLVAAKAVPAANFFQRLRNGIDGLFT